LRSNTLRLLFDRKPRGQVLRSNTLRLLFDRGEEEPDVTAGQALLR